MSWKTTYNPFGPEPVDEKAAELMKTVRPIHTPACSGIHQPNNQTTGCTHHAHHARVSKHPLYRPSIHGLPATTGTHQQKPQEKTTTPTQAEGNGRTHVYLYTLPASQTNVAYKRLVTHHPDLAANAMMLVKEAMLLHRLQHDHIVRVLGMVYEDATAGMLTEYLEGTTLRTLLLEAMATVQRDRYTMRDGLRWCLDVAKALAYCHDECGVLHRDVNPFNIVIVQSNNRAKLVDFGFHKILSTEKQQDSDNPSAFTSPVGALMYMAPEVWRAQPYGRPADVFSFGCTMYEVLAGTIRSAAMFPDTATQKQLAGYAERVAGGKREKRPIGVGGEAVSVLVWGLVEACWAPDPAKRPSMRGVVQVLEQVLREGREDDAQQTSAWCLVQ